MLSRNTLIAALAFAALTKASPFPGRLLEARHEDGDCSVQPTGTGPSTSNPDTDTAFLSNPVYSQAANQVQTPSGYSLVYQNLQDATTTSGYLGFDYVTSYNPGYCASRCQNAWPGCESFNIYFERDPTLDPGVNCTNPASLTNIKCSYWSSCITQSSATNNGQYCEDFHSVIAGSNGYVANTQCGAATTTAPATKTSTATTPPATSAVASPLAQCPQPVSYIIPGPDRSLYAICLNTDYQIPSPQIYYGVQDNRACGSLCDSQSGCTKAVFNLGTQTCYLKGSPSVQASDWQPSSTGFQTLQRVPDGTVINSCPNAYTIVENGITWTACPATSLAYSSPNIWSSVASEYACAALCECTKGCQKFVYNFNTQTCYNDANASLTGGAWLVNAGTAVYYRA